MNNIVCFCLGFLLGVVIGVGGLIYYFIAFVMFRN